MTIMCAITPELYPTLMLQASALLRGNPLRFSMAPGDLLHMACERIGAYQEKGKIVDDDPGQVRGLFQTTMKRTLVDIHRRQSARRRVATGADALDEQDDVSPYDACVRSEVIAALTRLKGVHPQSAIVVRELGIEGKSTRKLAKELNKSPATINRHWMLGLQWLRAELS